MNATVLLEDDMVCEICPLSVFQYVFVSPFPRKQSMFRKWYLGFEYTDGNVDDVLSSAMSTPGSHLRQAINPPRTPHASRMFIPRQWHPT